ncbi:MAG: chemotaxis protein CheA [Microscillaceae bacterium]|nr:chemotaxis protein CheA [Microscillaceae bacterium]
MIQALNSGEKVNYKGFLTRLKVKLNSQQGENETGPSLATFSQENAASPHYESQEAQNWHIQFNDTVQIPVQKLDKLLTLTSEINIERERLQTEVSAQKSWGKKDFNALNRLAEELQFSVLNARLVRVELLFQKFQRVVREVARVEGKEVQLILEGTEIEIDRNVLQAISDALVHLVRNAVSHGLLTPEKRRQSGKPPAGTVCLRAFPQQSRVVIEVEDDGEGINLARVRQKIVEKGWLSEADAQKLSSEGLYPYLFEPGFTSAPEITAISGRGVGLDVVKKAIDAVGGKIQVRSEPGRGTAFQMHLPVSLTLRPVLLFDQSGHQYGVPLMYVEGVVRLHAQNVFAVGQGQMLRQQDELMPLLDLGQIFRAAHSSTKAENSDVGIVLGNGLRRVCIRVEKLWQQKDLLEKALPAPLEGERLFSGAGILGSGRVCLIIEVAALLQMGKTRGPDN